MAAPVSDFAGLTVGGNPFATNFAGPDVGRGDGGQQPAQQQTPAQKQLPPQPAPPMQPFAQRPPAQQQPPTQQPPILQPPIQQPPIQQPPIQQPMQGYGMISAAPLANDPWGLVSAGHQAPAPAAMVPAAPMPAPQIQPLPPTADPPVVTPPAPSTPATAGTAVPAKDALFQTYGSNRFVMGDPVAVAPQADPFNTGTQTMSAVTDSPPGPQPAVGAQDNDDFWSQMGFGLEAKADEVESAPADKAEKSAGETSKERAKYRGTSIRASVIPIPNQVIAAMAEDDTGADRLRCGLPSGKEYKAEIETHSRLGAVFQAAKEVKKSLYCKVSMEVIEALGDRPILAYMAKNSGAIRAGIGMGDIVLKINDVEATDPKQAHELIHKLPRPLTLTMLKPDLPIVLGENQHMVKYNNNKPRAPSQIEGWKAKYVVVGGIIGEPHFLNMYSSKYEYDRAVASTLAGEVAYNVKLKSFDLRGCHIISDRHMLYDGFKVWHYFMIVPPVTPGAVQPNIIKISHPMKEGLIPIFEGVKRIVNDPKMKARPNF